MLGRSYNGFFELGSPMFLVPCSGISDGGLSISKVAKVPYMRDIYVPLMPRYIAVAL